MKAVAPRTAIHDAAKSMSEGEQRRMVCPWCNDKEKSFSMKREKGYIYYTCHRASCNSSMGRMPIGITEAAVVATIRNKIKDLLPIPDSIKKLLLDKYHMDELDVARLGAGWYESSKFGNRLAMPIVGPSREAVGYTLRSLDGKQPKCLIFLDNFDRPKSCYYRCWVHGFRYVVITEDQLSACRAANCVSSMALLGTHMDVMMARELARRDPDHVVVCLDKDAQDKGIELISKWGGMFRKITFAVPDVDLKDMEPLALRKFLVKQFGDVLN